MPRNVVALRKQYTVVLYYMGRCLQITERSKCKTQNTAGKEIISSTAKDQKIRILKQRGHVDRMAEYRKDEEADKQKCRKNK